MASVFFSYAHADEDLRDQLEKQLSVLKRQGVIEAWHDRRIAAGENLHGAIDEHINADDIILLLVSPDFLASAYCYEVEMTRAMERHERGEAVVIPVILRPCEWLRAPFGHLRAAPQDGKPITRWPDRDEAFLDVAVAVREAAERINGPLARPARSPTRQASASTATAEPRSSNLRLARTFTQRDKDRFKLDTFEFIARFFENSLAELGARNPGIEGDFRRVDANRFFATIYRNGKDVARGTVYMGADAFSRGINYAQGELTSSNTMNESLSVEADDQSLYLTSLGLSFHSNRDQKLSQQGAAELYWSLLIGRLQGQR